jgi:two-component system chemotaxis sensor kinase CheA
MKRNGVRIGLGARLFLGFLLVSFVGLGVCAVLVDRNVQERANTQVTERLTYEVTMLGQMTANALFGPIDPTDTSLSGVVRQLADAVHTNLTILAPDGTVVADSDESDAARVAKESSSPEIRQALAQGTGVAVRWSGSEPRLFVAQTIVRDGKTLGLARASVPMAAVDAAARNVRRQMSYGGLAAVGIAGLLAGLTTIGILRPIRKLAEGAKRVGTGDLGHRVDVRTNDEIGDLAHALNDMTSRLQIMVGSLDQRNRDMRLVLDNVAQGLVTVGRDGGIAEERSSAIDRWFGCPTAGRRVWDLFEKTTPMVRAAMWLGWRQVFADVLPLDLALSQLPHRIRDGERYFDLGYEPIYGNGSLIDKCLVVVSDVTSVVAAEKVDVEQREQMSLFASVAKDREGVADFLKATGEIVLYVCTHADDASRVTEVTRGIHTIKGNCGLFGLTSLSTICHDIETRMAEAEVGNMVSVSDKQLLTEAWDLLVARARELLGEIPPDSLQVGSKEMAELVTAIRQGQHAEALIQSIALWSMDPLDRRLTRLATQTTQLAARMGKAGVTVDVKPTNVRLPGERWSPFWSTLSHVMRNALDHGIESREERVRAGKPEHGRITLSAVETSDQVIIEVADDGRGINWARLRDKAISLGLPSESEPDLISALFADGVSTAETLSEFSGRGVGLSAVRSACEDLGGHVEIESAIGLGTKFRFWFAAPGVIESAAKVRSTLSLPPRSAPPASRSAGFEVIVVRSSKAPRAGLLVTAGGVSVPSTPPATTEVLPA